MNLGINDRNHPLTRLSCLSASEELRGIDLAFFLLRKQKESDRYYRAKEFALSEEVGEWLKRQIVQEVRRLQIKEEDGSRRFEIGEYHLEVKKRDRLARLKLEKEIGLPYERKTALLRALANPDPLLDPAKTEFQIVQTELDGKRLHFFFYRKPKQSASRKRLAFGRSGELDFAKEELVELGGNIEFVLWDNELYISRLDAFENAFDYRDHVLKAKERNLEAITSLPFFEMEEADKDRFKRDCGAFFYTRTLAQMGPKQLEAIERSFGERCGELRMIRKRVPAHPERAEEYRRMYAPLWELYDFLDLERERVVYPEGRRPTVLLHFFADKIVQSFLTKEFGLTDFIDRAEEQESDRA
ncbi:Kiwa anti-phage protein KwaB-like domain-containing protein [Saccharibacillus deserti]|uniref:Kiwa anti-phage protein KwaB-like domain-containing protein n=1 Tax=Saccharibacillus deserti TaxID=1634444 RepID=UPI0015533329|nr:Kiwa anti-phage protein KwaB-like domain-containing protein [Saccharibacillus deserti]